MIGKRVLGGCGVLIAVLAGLAFSPWALAPGRSDPSLLGVPWALWVGITISSCISICVAVAANVPGRGDDPS